MSSTVIIVDPQGQAHDVPYESMHDAISHGGTPGVRVKAPDDSVRVVPATKVHEAYQHGGTLLPIEEQQTDHPGFWHAVSEDVGPALKGMAMGAAGPPAMAYQSFVKARDTLKSLQDTGSTVEARQARVQKAAGYSLPYRVAANVAGSLGANVPGMEAAAKEGDPGGVLGHAAVPAAMATAPIVGEAAARTAGAVAPPVIRTTGKVLNNPAAATAIGAGVGHTMGEGFIGALAGHAARDVFSGIFEKMSKFGLAKEADTLKAAVYRDATKGNVPYAGEEVATPKPEAPAPKGAPIERDATLNKRNIPEYAGEDPPKQVKSLIDAAVPPTGETRAANLRTTSQVEFYLKKGNVEAAQAAFEKVKPADWPPAAPQSRGTIADIRESLKVKGPTADSIDERGIQQEMAQNLQKHGYMAESDARKEFIARNSTGIGKGDLVKAAGGTVPDQPVKLTKTPGVKATGATEDLTDILTKSVAQAKARRLVKR